MKIFQRHNKIAKLAVITTFILLCTGYSVKAYEYEAVKSYNQAIDYSKKNDYPNAIVCFKKAVLVDPTFMDAYFNMGSIYQYLDDKDKAIESYMVVFKFNPNDYETVMKLAILNEAKGDYSKALDFLSIIPNTSEKYIDALTLKKSINKKLAIKSVTSIPKVNSVSPATSSASTVKTTAISTSEPKPEPKVTTLKNFQGPTGIALDSRNNMYVANYTSNSVVQITPDGKRKIVAKGKPISGPVGLAVDLNNNIYVANYSSNEILKITPQGIVSVIIRNIKKPYYLLIDEKYLYISEQGNNAIIKVRLK